MDKKLRGMDVDKMMKSKRSRKLKMNIQNRNERL